MKEDHLEFLTGHMEGPRWKNDPGPEEAEHGRPKTLGNEDFVPL
jgi:hypothetical protein